jgi:hypothetical protein
MTVRCSTRVPITCRKKWIRFSVAPVYYRQGNKNPRVVMATWPRLQGTQISNVPRFFTILFLRNDTVNIESVERRMVGRSTL